MARPPVYRCFMRRGFTLVEMLVVLGIIAILVGLLMPAVMATVNRARITRMGTEIAQIKDAIEKYKTDKGDYPPNLRGNPAAVMRHIRRCYPKISPTELAALWDFSTGSVWPVMQLDEGESLVFWLAKTRNNPQYPFGLAGGSGTEYQSYYDFDERRLTDDDLDTWFSFRPEYAKDTFYLYVDSRSYLYPNGTTYAGYAQHLADSSLPPVPCVGESMPETSVLPYWTETNNPAAVAGETRQCLLFLPQNPTSYQLLCAGQDGDFGYFDSSGTAVDMVKFFPSGGNFVRADNDNITDFSSGKKLSDHIP
jgi:prepilin-type N-terminal cleavage/methylation domain-containing protein